MGSVHEKNASLTRARTWDKRINSLVRHPSKLPVSGCHRERIHGLSMESGGGVPYRDQERGILNARRSATFQHQDRKRKST